MNKSISDMHKPLQALSTNVKGEVKVQERQQKFAHNVTQDITQDVTLQKALTVT